MKESDLVQRAQSRSQVTALSSVFVLGCLRVRTEAADVTNQHRPTHKLHPCAYRRFLSRQLLSSFRSRAETDDVVARLCP